MAKVKEINGIITFQRSNESNCICCKGKHVFSRYIKEKDTDTPLDVNSLISSCLKDNTENKLIKITVEIDDSIRSQEDIKSELKKRLLSVIDNALLREKQKLDSYLGADPNIIESLLNELCDKGILSKEVRYICPNCSDIQTLSQNLLKDKLINAEHYECEDCFEEVNINTDKYIFYNIENGQELLNW